MKLIKKWAIDINSFACDILRHKLPETKVKNKDVKNFLTLLKEQKKLCEKFFSYFQFCSKKTDKEEECDKNDDEDGDNGDYQLSSEVFEIEELFAIFVGDPKNLSKPTHHFKVCWKGYGLDEDTWSLMIA